MVHITKELSYTPSYPVREDAFFLCIDTTGFQAEVSAITTIGIARFSDQNIILEQWFHDAESNQQEILSAFLERINTKQTVITYYGNRFSLPFLEKKCLEYHMSNPLSAMESQDYYDVIHLLRKFLGLSSCRQSSIEAYFDCKRSCNLSGKKLVKAYQNYRKSPNVSDIDVLLLHNQESLEILLQLTSIFSYNDLIHGNYTDCFLSSISSTQIVFTFKLPYAVLKPLAYADADCSLSMNGRDGTLCLSVDDHAQFRHYFPNPKDYIYLTVEDRAVHKSLASYVPKEYRQKATHHTCYERLSVDHPALKEKPSLHRLITDTIGHLVGIA